jgi:UDP-3-O-[3-hydroxymyristoyl] N-acetylglucosamine deacetylase/3-hydroxyacyl-[acyl-carrier-protein] dehydratase
MDAAMFSEIQQTLADSSVVEGRGLFMGQPATVRFRPAPANHGIVFLRTDVTDGGEPVRIPALIRHVTRRPRRTALCRGAVAVETCEHCLSALAGMGIDNVIIEIDGPELPAGDGSAQPFVEAIEQAGVKSLDEPRAMFTLDEPITVEEGDAMIAALPADRTGLQVIYDLDYGEQGPIRPQVHAFNCSNGRYARQIAPARTFVLESEARALQQRGLGVHLTPKDVLVIGAEGPLGGNALRFDDELVRHKVLDLIGDLSLLGCGIRGRIVACRSGHALAHRLTRRLSRLREAQRRSTMLRSDGMIDVQRISRILPHRYPMLLVDRVLQVDSDRRAVGVKNVTVNEPFFQGHYPGTPIMPGVLIVEAMAQLSGVLLSRKLEHTGKLAVLLSMDRVKLRRPVTPGDQLVIEVETIRVRSRTGHTRCQAHVGPHLVAEAEIKFMLVDADATPE